MKIHLASITIALSSLSLFAQGGIAAQDHIEGASAFPLTGCHVKRSELCTSPHDGSSCSDQFQDTLNIEPNKQDYQVTLFSTQASQHVCSFSFQMSAINGALVHDTPYGPITIKLKDGSLNIYSKGIDPTALGLGICGVRADIDGLRFPMAGRVDRECSIPY
jgi:hypothetical protein